MGALLELCVCVCVCVCVCDCVCYVSLVQRDHMAGVGVCSRGVTLWNGVGQMDMAQDNPRNRVPRDTSSTLLSVCYVSLILLNYICIHYYYIGVCACVCTPRYATGCCVHGWLGVVCVCACRGGLHARSACTHVAHTATHGEMISQTFYHPNCVFVFVNTSHPPPPPLHTHTRYDTSDKNTMRLVNRLDALVTVMAYCRGVTCRYPWAVLHPDGSVMSIKDAMNKNFDSLYASYQKFAFRKWVGANDFLYVFIMLPYVGVCGRFNGAMNKELRIAVRQKLTFRKYRFCFCACLFLQDQKTQCEASLRLHQGCIAAWGC